MKFLEKIKHFLNNLLKKKDFFKFISLFLVLGIIVFFIILQCEIYVLYARQGKVIDELGEKLQTIQDLKDFQREVLIEFSKDINEMRSYLLLPEKSYKMLSLPVMEEERSTEEELISYLQKLNASVLGIQSVKESKDFAKSETSELAKKEEKDSLQKENKNVIEDDIENNIEEDFVQQKKEEILKIINDTSVQEFLKNNNLDISQDYFEEDDRIYFDVKNAEGKILQKIILEKGTGYIKVSGADGTGAIKISEYLQNPKKKLLIPNDLPEFSKVPVKIPESFTLLVGGKHDVLMDTIMLVHLNNIQRTIDIISIPRDLFYNGRKVNSIVHYYGMEELKRQLSEFTGITIDNYIVVDMYAFAEIVDVFGGIDVTLDEDLIDPSYKTKDNGEVGTLYYKKGKHHVNGRQSLRIARSRYTSSDFSRASRQHKILRAFQDKTKEFGFGDASVVTKILSTIFSKVETDFSFQDIFTAYFRYKDFEIDDTAVLTTYNVLEPNFTGYIDIGTNFQFCLKNKQAPKCKLQNRGEYILLPKDGDWDVIKWFIDEKIRD